MGSRIVDCEGSRKAVGAQPMAALPPFAAVIVAAGKGLRAGGTMTKQFADWRGKPLVRHSAEAFARLGARPIVVAVPADALVQAQQVLSGIDSVQIVSGGPSRRERAARRGRRPQAVRALAGQAAGAAYGRGIAGAGRRLRGGGHSGG